MSEKPSNAMPGAMIMISDVVESCEVVWLVRGSSRPSVDWRAQRVTVEQSSSMRLHDPQSVELFRGEGSLWVCCSLHVNSSRALTQ